MPIATSTQIWQASLNILPRQRMAALSNRSLQFLDRRLTFKNVPLLGFFYTLFRGDSMSYLDTEVTVWVQMRVQSNTGSTSLHTSVMGTCVLATLILSTVSLEAFSSAWISAYALNTHCPAAAATFLANRQLPTFGQILLRRHSGWPWNVFDSATALQTWIPPQMMPVGLRLSRSN